MLKLLATCLLFTAMVSLAQPPANKIDINSATTAQLMSLPGINKIYAARIITYRPYKSKNELISRGVITHLMYVNIADKIIAHRPK